MWSEIHVGGYGNNENDVTIQWCHRINYYYIIAGFVFSNDEPTALVQYQGGPCAVIAPVQAFLLKSIIFDFKKDLKNINSEFMSENSFFFGQNHRLTIWLEN